MPQVIISCTAGGSKPPAAMGRRQSAALRRLAQAKLKRMTRTSDALDKFAKDEIAAWTSRRENLQREIREALQVLDNVAREDIEDLKSLRDALKMNDNAVTLASESDSDDGQPVIFKPERK